MLNAPITFCTSVFNFNRDYLNLAIDSVLKYSYYGPDANFIIYNEHDEKCNRNDFRDWLFEKSKLFKSFSYMCGDEYRDEEKYNMGYYSGIGGGMNFCAEFVKTDYIMFIHSDMFVSKNFDSACLEIFKKYPNEKLWVNPYRFQPNCFNEEDRPGTCFFPYDQFGYKHDNFKEDDFIQSAKDFSESNPNIEYNKGEGVSGLMKTSDWKYIGGNDPRYCPAYWEDSDIFLRCQLAGYKFVITSNSVIWHFGSRSEHSNFPSDDLIQPNQKAIRSEASKLYEANSAKAFITKWGFWPDHNEHGFVTFPPGIDKTKYEHLIRL